MYGRFFSSFTRRRARDHRSVDRSRNPLIVGETRVNTARARKEDFILDSREPSESSRRAHRGGKRIGHRVRLARFATKRENARETRARANSREEEGRGRADTIRHNSRGGAGEKSSGFRRNII